MRDQARRRLLIGVVLLVFGVFLGALVTGAGVLRPVVRQMPIAIGAEGVVLPEHVGQVYAIYTADGSMADDCRVTAASGRAVPVVKAPSTDTVTINSVTYVTRFRFTATTTDRMSVVCANPAGTLVGLDDPFARNTTTIVVGSALGGAVVAAGLAVLFSAFRGRREDLAAPYVGTAPEPDVTGG